MGESPLHTAGTWLVRLRDEDLSDTEMSEWVEWCEKSPQNLRAFEELQSLWRQVGEHPPSPDSVEALLSCRVDGHGKHDDDDDTVKPDNCENSESFQSAQSSDNPQSGRVRNRNKRSWAMAASLVLAVATASSWLALRSPVHQANDTAVERIAAVDSVKTPTAQNKQGLLPDGSHVDLGARTVLNVDYSAVRRRLELEEGQAFFQVIHDKTRPFVVSAGEIQVLAIGTAFDIRRTSSQVTITVQEGAVKAIKDQDNLLTATTGQQLVFETATGRIRKSLVDPANALAWRAGRLEFSGDPLEVVIASVNRYSKHPIVLEDPRLKTLTFTGTVFTNSIAASLDALEQVFPVRIRHASSGAIVISPVD